MKLQVVAVALTALVVCVSALPQQAQQQQLTPQQQQQRRAQQQQQQQRQAQQGNRNAQQGGNRNAQAPGGGAGVTPVPLHLDPNLTLSKISKKNLDDFLASKEAVNELVNCFEDLRKCRARAGVSLVRDVRSLGRGARCKTCSPEEQAHTRSLVGGAISGLQQRHPQEWRRLLPEIGFLL